MSAQLAKIENRIFGTLSKYPYDMKDWNTLNFTYMAYPVGEFCNIASVVDQPLKEVYIGKDDLVRSIKTYSYNNIGDNYIKRKYGYKMVSQNYNYPSTPTESSSCDYTVYYISQSEYITRNVRLKGTYTTRYYYDGEKCDSVIEETESNYKNGRITSTYSLNGNESQSTYFIYPDEIKNVESNSSSTTIKSISGLIKKNIIAEPIKTIVERNETRKVIGGECKDYQMVSDSIPLLKSLYKLKQADFRYGEKDPVIKDNNIDFKAELYKAGEIITYDKYLNPEYVRLNDTQNRIYVWGYDGRYPIAVIDNMEYSTFNSSNLKAQLLKLEAYQKIENEGDCSKLKELNATIRNMIPKSAHITTYTYDPNFGMTSEIDDSNLGVIYSYDSFGRLTTKYDEDYKKLEDYNYHYKLQQ